MENTSDQHHSRCCFYRLLAILCLLLLVACGGSSTPAPAPTPSGGQASLQRLELSPASASLAVGTELNLHATGLYSDGSRRDLSDSVAWHSDDTTVLSVANGRIHALSAARTHIRARFDGRDAEASIEVTAATLQRLDIEPAGLRLAKGTQYPLSVFGLFSDGSRQALDDQVVWASLDPTLFSISAAGHLTALAVGSGVLRAGFGDLNAQIDVTVSDADLTTLRVTPASVELPAGSEVMLRIDGFYSDGSQQNLSAQARWQIDTPAVASLEGSRLRGLVSGDATLRADVGGLGIEVPVRVTDAVLSRLELDLGGADLPTGLSRPLRALGHFSDGSLRDLTAQVIWRSSDDARLAIANAAGSEGLATALAAGTVTVDAALDGIEIQATLIVSAASLQTLELEPVASRLAVGTGLRMQALGRYSDGSLKILSDPVTWSSDEPTIAAVANADGQAGQVQGLAVGDTRIRVQLGGISASVPLSVTAAHLEVITIEPAEISLASGERLMLRAVGGFSDGSIQPLGAAVRWESARLDVVHIDESGELLALQSGEARVSASLDGVTGSIPVRVSTATLTDLEITPASPRLASGTAMRFSAVAVYSDGSRRDVTAQAVWISANPTVLSVSNGDPFRVRAGAMGSARLTARFGGFERILDVEVTDATPTGLRITATISQLASGEGVHLSAVADFSDGSSQPLDDDVVWSSSDPALASVGNMANSRGWVVAASDRGGSVRIRAEYAGLSAEQLLDITFEPQRPVSLVVLPSPNVLRNDGFDSARITLRLRAAGAAAVVADGTLVAVSVSQDGQVLFSTTVSTSGGEAGFDFTTTASGLLLIEAQVAGSGVAGLGLLYAGEQPLVVVIPAAFADAERIDGVVQAGARFGFFLFNTSNRPIPLQGFVLENGGTELLVIDDPAQLNGGWLDGGVQLGFIVILSEAVVDQGLGAYYLLLDPSSSSEQPARLGVVYSSPQ
ncbi:hypothetical protein MNBD_GAMMA20-1494 [hydrothermal vent metagenome]|uniref:BIG2 domain-containing protein n=1 Tax=hydrothermal vent metagenome TaxID=652676 RepID=A0A3B1AI34_9ZZZZ